MKQADVEESDRIVVAAAEIQTAIILDLHHQESLGLREQGDGFAEGGFELFFLIG